jgi:antitoxin component of MazEF toxin-antitoxin module
MAGLIKFERKVRRTGGTLAVTIPPEVQRAIDLKEGQDVLISLTGERDILIQVKRAKS